MLLYAIAKDSPNPQKAAQDFLGATEFVKGVFHKVLHTQPTSVHLSYDSLLYQHGIGQGKSGGYCSVLVSSGESREELAVV